jgi:hypothetical protein
MAYVKPGVEITQIQASVTPVLIAPDLEALVLGAGFHWQDPTLDDSEYSTEYTGEDLEILLSGFNADYHDISNADDGKLVIVDLYVTSGEYAGYTYHYNAGGVYGMNGGSDYIDINTTTHTVTIQSGISLPSELTGADDDWVIPRAKASIGYRSLKTDLNVLRSIERISDIRTTIGEINTWNPLAYGTYLAMANGGVSINVMGVADPVDGTVDAVDYSSALDELEPHEVYAIAPMENNWPGFAATLATHVNEQSEAINKHERIGIVNIEIPTETNGYQTADVNKLLTAQEIKARNFAYGYRRLFSTHPDIAYVQETRHISTLYPAWIQASFDSFTDMTFSDLNAYAKLTGNITLADGTKYWKNDNITATMVTNMMNNGVHELSVSVPVPGFYYGACIAGQIAGEEPSQPLTNVPIAGLTKTHGSQDYFSEENLNTMAEGGTYIMTQAAPTAPIVSRHQMSTDVSSIAKRELSVTKALDYTSKFVRNGLRPYIGRYTITPSFLRLINGILVGQGRWLVREGHLNDFKVVNVLQDPVSPDSILVEVQVLVKYPVNYIKIQLIF